MSGEFEKAFATLLNRKPKVKAVEPQPAVYGQVPRRAKLLAHLKDSGGIITARSLQRATGWHIDDSRHAIGRARQDGILETTSADEDGVATYRAKGER